jgi:hypothetical protein
VDAGDVLLAVPLAHCFTARAARADPELCGVLTNDVDEEDCIAISLLVEKAKGADSPHALYIEVRSKPALSYVYLLR